MMTALRATGPTNPALTRLGKLARLSSSDRNAIELAATRSVIRPVRRELMVEGAPVPQAMLILAGWACRARVLRDGRRQIMDLILPGELLGHCRHPQPLALASIFPLTELVVCPAPDASRSPSLADAYAISAARSEAHLLRQITRLGRLSASERVADLLLELHQRLLLSGSAQPLSFRFPLTQETVADVLGLTPVHVNRTLKTLRNQGILSIARGAVDILDVDGLRDLADAR